jgi:hypothetical protein
MNIITPLAAATLTWLKLAPALFPGATVGVRVRALSNALVEPIGVIQPYRQVELIVLGKPRLALQPGNGKCIGRPPLAIQSSFTSASFAALAHFAASFCSISDIAAGVLAATSRPSLLKRSLTQGTRARHAPRC